MSTIRRCATMMVAIAGTAAPGLAQQCGWSTPLTWVRDLTEARMTTVDFGSGPRIIVAGTHYGTWMGRWEGYWAHVNPPEGEVNAFATFDDGAGPALYAAGQFTSAVGVPARNIARFDGSPLGWSPVGSAAAPDGVAGTVFGMHVADLGDGPALYVAGNFSEAGGVPANRVAKWDGIAWSALGDGVNNYSRAMMSFDDGSGMALYIGGAFSFGGNPPSEYIMRWNGTAWGTVGDGVDDQVFSLTVADLGHGPVLVAGGGWLVPGSPVAQWDGLTWSHVGWGFGGGGLVLTLAVFDDGYEETLYAGGFYGQHGNPPILHRLEGQQWVALPSPPGIPRYPRQLHVSDVGGPALHASYRIGWHTYFDTWSCEQPPAPCYPNCDTSTNPPILTIDDFLCFINEFAAASTLPPAQQVTHYANCDGNTTEPILTVDDFICFINAFAEGCS
jgi:hypothetical protein